MVSCPLTFSSPGAPDGTKVSTVLLKYPKLQKVIVFNDKTIPQVLVLKLPLQQNGYDCGVYVCKFVEVIINNLPEMTTLDSINSNLLNISSITDDDISNERKLIKSDLLLQIKEYTEFILNGLI